jgi:endoglucanase
MKEITDQKERRGSGLLVWIMLIASQALSGQGFLHADGKQIVNGAGENVILRGIGTGNWMLQEGYMMETSDIAGTQHEFRERLINSIGEALTDSFYTVWLNNHCTRTDIDSLASWGFNSVRVAMHYKWFTLPIEEEPVLGQQTWLGRGFELIDSLLEWCGDNRIYLILDLHGAPGGQGANESISDYDPSKPSLWESQANRDKTVALWMKLAERYSEEPWIGGYDLINETNWSFPGGTNSPLRDLFGRITDSIRVVDQHHMIIIEGNWFANDFAQLTPPWDEPYRNMAYSFHKYWSYNDPGSLDWVISLRDAYNVPVWLGESGENSNTWFTNLIALCESKNIGWSWWPLKKGGLNNPLRVEINDDYLRLIDNWRGTGAVLSPEEAFQAVLTFAGRHRIGNCHFQRDVVDAMIRQPHSKQALPFHPRTVHDLVFAADYDLGRNGYAYFDLDTADYHGDMDGEYTAWNSGWSYRNDGVDLEPCSDAQTNGFNVGWTADDEWLGYTLTNDTAASYTMEIRSASSGSGSQVHVEVNGVDATGPVSLPGTGGWQSWSTTQLDNVILPEGKMQVRIVFDRGGSNLNWFRLTDPQPDSVVPFAFVSAKSAVLKNEIYVSLNKHVTSPASIPVSDFALTQRGAEAEIESVRLSETDGRVVVITSSDPLFYNQTIQVTYTGQSIMHGEQKLSPFSSQAVKNRLATHFAVPGRIQAESFYVNSGLVLESCSDAGGGQNTGYANPGDYADYILYVPEAGEYAMDFRVATEYSNARLSILAETGDGFGTLGSMAFSRTGGWQVWTTQSTSLTLEAGKYRLRLLVTGEEHNLNWFEFRLPVSMEDHPAACSSGLYPNPASGHTTLTLDAAAPSPVRIEIMAVTGKVVYSSWVRGDRLVIDTSRWPEGLYVVCSGEGSGRQVRKLLVTH